MRGLPVERERRVGVGQVQVRADLDGPVAGVLDDQGEPLGVPAPLSTTVPSRADRSRPLPLMTRRPGDRVVDGDELAAVGEGRLDLDVVQHLGDALHHLVGARTARPLDHQVGDPGSVAGPLDHPGREQGDRLGVVEADAARQPVAGDHAGHGEQQLLGLGGVRCTRATLEPGCFAEVTRPTG